MYQEMPPSLKSTKDTELYHLFFTLTNYMVNHLKSRKSPQMNFSRYKRRTKVNVDDERGKIAVLTIFSLVLSDPFLRCVRVKFLSRLHWPRSRQVYDTLGAIPKYQTSIPTNVWLLGLEGLSLQWPANIRSKSKEEVCSSFSFNCQLNLSTNTDWRFVTH